MLALMQVPRVETPRTTWARYFFGDSSKRQTIIGRAAMSGFSDLRKHLLPPNDEEIRVWGGFGLTYLQAIVLRKRAGKWTAVRLLSVQPGTPKAAWTKLYEAPKDGWPNFWKKAQALGIWTLPDDSTLPSAPGHGVLDGFSYVVELQRAGVYRAYAYINPDTKPVPPQAEAVLALDRLLETEFPHPRP